MKKFRFRLEAVEKHRKLQEQEKQVWLSKCVARLRATERKLLDLDRREVEARREFAAMGDAAKGGATPAKFWALDQFISGQKIRRVELKQELQQNEQEVSIAYREFLKARQQRKIMEKLHEKRLQQYKDEFRKHDMREQDELYTMRNRLAARRDADDEEREDD